MSTELEAPRPAKEQAGTRSVSPSARAVGLARHPSATVCSLVSVCPNSAHGQGPAPVCRVCGWWKPFYETCLQSCVRGPGASPGRPRQQDQRPGAHPHAGPHRRGGAWPSPAHLPRAGLQQGPLTPRLGLPAPHPGPALVPPAQWVTSPLLPLPDSLPGPAESNCHLPSRPGVE